MLSKAVPAPCCSLCPSHSSLAPWTHLLQSPLKQPNSSGLDAVPR